MLIIPPTMQWGSVWYPGGEAGCGSCFGRSSLAMRTLFFSSRRRHTRLQGDWSSDVCSSDLFTVLVTAAAEGEVLDDAAVGGRDDEDRERGRCGKEDGEIRVLAQVLERFLRAVCRRREAVRAEADPGQEGDERDVPEKVRVLQVFRAAQEEPFQPLPGSRAVLRLRRHGLCGRAHREVAKNACTAFSVERHLALASESPRLGLHHATRRLALSCISQEGAAAARAWVPGPTSARGARMACFLGALLAGLMLVRRDGAHNRPARTFPVRG